MATKKNKTKAALSGETFASLQISKNIDADTIENKLHLLYQLQQADSKIDAIYLLRGELPLEVQDLEDEVIGLNTRISNLQREIKDLEKFISNQKQEVIDARAAIQKYEQQRNNVKNNREFDSLSKEIEYKDLESQLADKKATEATKNLTAKKELIETVKEELKVREEDLKAKRKELENIAKETEKDEAELLAQSEQLQEQIDSRLLAAYEKVRSNTRNKMAVVTVARGACGGCFNKITPQREIDIEESKRIVVCEYCGRILVSSKFKEGGDSVEQTETEKPKRATKKSSK